MRTWCHSGSGRFLQLHAGKTGEKFRGILPTSHVIRSAFGKVSQAILNGRLAPYRARITQNIHQVSYEMANSPAMVKRCYHRRQPIGVAKSWFALCPGSAGIIRFPAQKKVPKSSIPRRQNKSKRLQDRSIYLCRKFLNTMPMRVQVPPRLPDRGIKLFVRLRIARLGFDHLRIPFAFSLNHEPLQQGTLCLPNSKDLQETTR